MTKAHYNDMKDIASKAIILTTIVDHLTELTALSKEEDTKLFNFEEAAVSACPCCSQAHL